MSFSFRKPRRMTSLNAPPEIRPAWRIHAISDDDFTERKECSVGARGLKRSSRDKKGRYCDVFARNRMRGRISSEIEPDIVGKEM